VLRQVLYDKIIGHVTSINTPESFISTTSTTIWYFYLTSPAGYYLPRHHQSFDTVSHSHLVYKLNRFNIGGELCSWFLAYATNRSQFVSINGCNSNLLPVESGVPQRSTILGPLLFIIYMNDISSAVVHSRVFLFADDTKCFNHIKVPSDMQLLQHDLNCLSNWSIISPLTFYPSKSIHLSFKCKIITSYYVHQWQSYKFLPFTVLICDNLNWDEHHNYTLKKAYKTLGLVRRTFCKTIISSVRSLLHLCGDLICWKTLLRFMSDYKAQLIKLYLFPLMYIFEISDIVFFVNCLKNPTPSFNVNSYMSECY